MSTNLVGKQYFTFNYANDELLKAAKAKLTHHTKRLEHWQEQYRTREETLREKGVDFKTRVRPGQFSNSTYNNNSVNLDPEMKASFDEANERVETHAEAVETFSRWVRAFEHSKLATQALSTPSYDLTIDDVHFFGL